MDDAKKQAAKAVARGRQAGWANTANGRVLLGILERRARGETRQLTTEEIMTRYRADRARLNGHA